MADILSLTLGLGPIGLGVGVGGGGGGGNDQPPPTDPTPDPSPTTPTNQTPPPASQNTPPNAPPSATPTSPPDTSSPGQGGGGGGGWGGGNGGGGGSDTPVTITVIAPTTLPDGTVTSMTLAVPGHIHHGAGGSDDGVTVIGDGNGGGMHTNADGGEVYTSYSRVVSTVNGTPTTWYSALPTSLSTATGKPGGAAKSAARSHLIAGLASALVIILLLMLSIFLRCRRRRREREAALGAREDEARLRDRGLFFAGEEGMEEKDYGHGHDDLGMVMTISDRMIATPSPALTTTPTPGSTWLHRPIQRYSDILSGDPPVSPASASTRSAGSRASSTARRTGSASGLAAEDDPFSPTQASLYAAYASGELAGMYGYGTWNEGEGVNAIGASDGTSAAAVAAAASRRASASTFGRQHNPTPSTSRSGTVRTTSTARSAAGTVYTARTSMSVRTPTTPTTKHHRPGTADSLRHPDDPFRNSRALSLVADGDDERASERGSWVIAGCASVDSDAGAGHKYDPWDGHTDDDRSSTGYARPSYDYGRALDELDSGTVDSHDHVMWSGGGGLAVANPSPATSPVPGAHSGFAA